jgi:hypothetical protein
VLNLLKPALPYLLAAIAIGGSWMWGYMARGAAEGERAAQAAAAMQIAADERLTASLAAQQELHAAQLVAAERRTAARQQAVRVVDEIVEEIRNEPTSSDCVSSPAVVRALTSLRALEAARADGSN